MFDKLFREVRERLAKQDAQARTSFKLRRGYWKLDYKDKSAAYFYFVKIRANQINKSKFIKPINLGTSIHLVTTKTTYEP